MTVFFIYCVSDKIGHRHILVGSQSLQSLNENSVAYDRDRGCVSRHWTPYLPVGNLYFQFNGKTRKSQAIDLQSNQLGCANDGTACVTEQNPTTLGGFIHAEMMRREMSAREFADFVGVSHASINKFLNHGISNIYSGKPVGEPSIEFLSKLSKATHTDICTLVALVAPDDTTTDAESQVIADRIMRLPPDKREIIDSFLLGLTLKGRQQGE